MSKEEFKIFAKKHKELARLVLEEKTTWQKLYEIYDIYGEDENIWNDIINKEFKVENIKDVFHTFKNIDLESVQKGVENLQKAVSLIQEINEPKNNNLDHKEPQPLYKYFED